MVSAPALTLPMFSPESTWSPPDLTRLPTRLEGLIGIDLETRDPELEKSGAGWAWRDGGYVAGYSIAADNFSCYLPIRHEGGGNVDARAARMWLNDVLQHADQPKVGANAILYDAGWAETDGVRIAGKLYDVQWAEPLLDEHRFSYSLDAVAKKYIGRGKDEALLRVAAAEWGVDPKADLWRLPSPLAGPYATEDAVLVRDVLPLQLRQLEEEGLTELHELETELGPLYRDMRRRGVRIDVDRAVRARDGFRVRVLEIVAEIKRRTGVQVELWTAESVARALDVEGIAYGRTEITNAPSITRGMLETHPSWLCKAIKEAREADKLASTFVDGALLGHVRDGRIHAEIHPLKSGDEKTGMKGTVTGRLSMSKPNPQAAPARTEAGKEIRRCFLPEEGERLASSDISQQEPRLLVHFASLARVNGEPLAGALEARDRWRADPDLSYHKFVAEISGLEYYPAKTLNLARIYGRGPHATSAALGITVAEAKALFAKHAEALPFVGAMSKLCQDRARDRGYLRSLLGRRARFSKWELAKKWVEAEGRFRQVAADGSLVPDGQEDKRVALSLRQARFYWKDRRVELWKIHKGLNSVIQPSAADQTKAAMRDALRAGLGKHLLLQVHDELVGSFPDERLARELRDVMVNAVQLEVPVKVDLKFADNWGDAK